MNIPPVSVVVPCFNAAAYLAEALESIFLQRHPAIEVIVIDDGSTDDSVGVAQRFADRIKLMKQTNQGISRARNAGLKICNGDIIAFLDADDIWPSDSLSIRLDALGRGPERAYVFGAVEHFVSPDVPEHERTQLICPETRPGRLAGSMLMHRDAFERVGYFDDCFRSGETMDWVARATEAGMKAVCVDATVLRRRIHANNTVRREAAQQKDYLFALKASMNRRRGPGAGNGQSGGSGD